MRNHHFNHPDPLGACNDIYNQTRCGLPVGHPVHSFVTGEFSRAEISVEAFVKDRHYATVAWQRENLGQWFSAWFAPSGSSVFHRVEALDTLTPEMIGLHVTTFVTFGFTEDELVGMGITDKSPDKS